MLWASISVWIIVGCIVRCMFFGFLLGSMVIYLCMSQSISVSKFWGGGWRFCVACEKWW